MSAAALVVMVSCGKPSSSSVTTAHSQAQGTNVQVFQVKGTVKELQSDGKTVEIRHEEIPNYMPAMTMPFEAKNPAEIKDLKPGDRVSFRMSVTDTDVWIDQIQKENSPVENAPVVNQIPSNSIIRVVRNVEPLQVGDPLPEYHFTNELGQAVSLSQFKGKALAITFIFTRCPLPNFCPRMSTNFEEAQKKMAGSSNGPTNWHLLTITFDPEFDTPAVLKSYSERFSADPQHWNYLTGDLTDITAIAEQFGETFWREQGALNHNLRTVVINSNGRVQNILQGNSWTAEELAKELTKAAGS